MSSEDNLGNHAVVKRKRTRPGKQTEARFDESTTENNLGKRAKVTASSSEQQRGGYNEAKEVIMSSNGDEITLDELHRSPNSGSFTIKPAVTIASVGRHCFAYHSCMVCRKKTNQNIEGKYGCAQHPDADTKARYCLRIQLKQDDISIWSTAFHDVAESLLGVSVDDFEELNDDGRKTVVFPAIGMQYNMTIGKTVGAMYTNYTIKSVKLPG